MPVLVSHLMLKIWQECVFLVVCVHKIVKKIHRTNGVLARNGTSCL